MYKKILSIFLLVITLLFKTQLYAVANAKINIDIINIFDGDTVKAKIDNNNFTIRLIGIDCYETSDINRAYKQAYNINK